MGIIIKKKIELMMTLASFGAQNNYHLVTSHSSQEEKDQHHYSILVVNKTADSGQQEPQVIVTKTQYIHNSTFIFIFGILGVFNMCDV